MWVWLVVLWFVLAVAPLILGFMKKLEFKWALLWLAVFFTPLTIMALILFMLWKRSIDMKC